MAAYTISDELKYADVLAANTGVNNDVESGLLWRNGLNGIVKVLSASEFTGRVLGITQDGEITWIDMTSATTAFGELAVAETHPLVQLSFLSGVEHVDTVRSQVANGGSVSLAALDKASVSLAAQADSRALLASRNLLSYRPGQGSIVRVTCKFGTPTSNSRQYAGFANNAGGFFFGYQNTSFGIFHLRNGRRHIQLLTITTAATAAQNAIVTLNGIATVVPLTNSTAANFPLAFTAYQIAKADYSAAGFYAEAYDNVIYFYADFSGPRAGSYSFSSTGSTGNAVATTTSIQSGVDFTETFIPQASWSGADIHDGNGASGFSITPASFGNVYQIQFQWLGYGVIYFSIENPVTEKIERVHTIRYPNSNVNPSLENPTGAIAVWTQASGGVPGAPLTMDTSCFFGGSEGLVPRNFGPIKFSAQAALVNITASVLRPVFSVRNNTIHNQRLLNHSVKMLLLSAASDSNKPINIFLVRNATLGAGTIQQVPSVIQDFPRWLPINSSQYSTVEVDKQSETLSGGRKVASFVIGKTTSEVIDISQVELGLRTGETLTIAALTSNGSNDFSASLTWVEEQQ